MGSVFHPIPQSIDFTKFAADTNTSETKYGLPQNIEFCRTCVISNQRPNSDREFRHTNQSVKKTIHFDENGICDACKAAEVKKKTDWELREKELIALCDKHRSTDGSYDCLVPGSGGKDSVYAAHILKYKYGMNPLTVTWAPHVYTEWGWKNHRAWINSGFDNYLFTPSGHSHRLLTRLAVENLFHPFQPFIIGQKSFAPKFAAQHGISLVFYGENEAEYGNPVADNKTSQRSTSYFTEDEANIYLGGTSLRDLQNDFKVSKQDLLAYLPADGAALEKAKVEVHYLGYYLKWHPQSCYYYAVENCGFQASPERTPGTYSKYNSIDDKIDDFHYYTTYTKFGIGRATYDSAQEIRSGDITREEGVALVKRYDGEFPERFAEEIFQYLSITPKEFPESHKCFEQPIMTREYFMKLADRFRSPHLWKFEDDKWTLRKTVFSEPDAAGMKDRYNFDFQRNTSGTP